MRISHTLALLATLAIPVAAVADPITTLFGTGIGTIGTADSHWTVTTPAAPTAPGVAATISTANPGWLAPTSGHWINDTGNGNVTEPVGTYDYFTTFSLAGLNNLTASVTLQIADDDTFGGVLLNGNLIAGCGTGSNFSSLTTCTINTGFLAGNNTIEIITANSAASGTNPTGLYVIASGTAANPSATPEPSSMVLLGTGLLSVAGFARRKFKA
jgi:hypothetical protein